VKKQILWFYSVILLALAGSTLVLIATVHGAGISPDSVAYIASARNFLAGEGLTLPYGPGIDTPLTHFPPLYPLLLSGGGLFGIDPLQAARWLQALLFGLLIISVGATLYHYTRPAVGWAIGGALLTIAAPTMLTMAIMVWSEMIFLLLCLLALVLLARFLENQDRITLVASALLVGTATLTRYSGLALVFTAIVAILLLHRGPSAKKLVNVLWFACLSLCPLLLWVLRNINLAGTATSRELAFHPIEWAHISQAIDTITGWFMLPVHLPTMVKLAVVLGLFMLLTATLLAPRLHNHQPAVPAVLHAPARSHFQPLIVLFILIYGAFLTFSISLIDANTPLDERILSPVYLVGVLLLLLTLHQFWETLKTNRLLQVVLPAVAMLFLALSIRQSAHLLNKSFHQGIGFAAIAWRDSELIQLVNELPVEALIYSNAPDGLHILTGRHVLPIPNKVNATTRSVNMNYANELAMIQQELSTKQGVVVYLTQLSRASSAQEEELRQQLALDFVWQTGDGAVYRLAPVGAQAVR
jgi:hypothetical protein